MTFPLKPRECFLVRILFLNVTVFTWPTAVPCILFIFCPFASCDVFISLTYLVHKSSNVLLFLSIFFWLSQVTRSHKKQEYRPVVLPEKLGGGVRPASKTLTQFMTKICHIFYPIYDLTKNSKPFL